MPHQDFPGVPVPRGGDTEGVGVGDRFAQQVDQRVVDARVLDASGSEKKPHGCSFARGVRVVFPSERLSRGAKLIVAARMNGVAANELTTRDEIGRVDSGAVRPR